MDQSFVQNRCVSVRRGEILHCSSLFRYKKWLNKSGQLEKQNAERRAKDNDEEMSSAQAKPRTFPFRFLCCHLRLLFSFQGQFQQRVKQLINRQKNEMKAKGQRLPKQNELKKPEQILKKREEKKKRHDLQRARQMRKAGRTNYRNKRRSSAGKHSKRGRSGPNKK